MMLRRPNGFNPLDEMGRVMDQVFGGIESETRAIGFYTHADVREADDAFVIEMDVAGLALDDIDIQVDGDVLTVKGKRDDTATENDVKWLRRERGMGDFARTFRVGEDIRLEGIAAEYTHGVLTLRLPKTEPVPARKIEVKVGN